MSERTRAVIEQTLARHRPFLDRCTCGWALPPSVPMLPTYERHLAGEVARGLAEQAQTTDTLTEVTRDRDELLARLTNREREWAEQLAREATLGDTGICRTCVLPITYAEVDEPGYLTRTGWSDGARRDALVCFKAVHYRHAPIVGRERAIWEKATEAARSAGNRDAHQALRALAEWHETKAEKARRFPGEGRDAVMAKAAEVHDDAARRIRRALGDADDQHEGGGR